MASIFKKIGRLGKKVLGGIGDAAKFAAPALNFVPGVGPLAAAAAGGLGGVLGELNDADGFNLGQGLGAGALGSAKNDSREREALQALQADYERRRGLRDQAIAMIGQPIAPAPDLSSIFADPGNPYARRA
jgi:hypothetical protein